MRSLLHTLRLTSGAYGLGLIAGLAISDVFPETHLQLCRFNKGYLIPIKSLLLPNHQALMDWLEEYPNLPLVIHLRQQHMLEGPLEDPASDPKAQLLGVAMDGTTHLWQQSWHGPDGPGWGVLLRQDALDAFLQNLGPHRERLVGISAGSLASFALEQCLPPDDPAQEFLKDLSAPSRQAYASVFASLEGQITLPMFRERQRRFQGTGQVIRVLLMGIGLLFCLNVLGGALLLSLKVISGDQPPNPHHQALTQRSEHLARELQHINEQLSAQKSLPHTQFSFLLDQIAQLRPKDIQLDQCIIYPKGKQQKAFMEGMEPPIPMQVVLQGKAREAGSIPAWGQAVQALAPIDRVEVLDSHYLQREEQYPFSLALYFPPP